MRYLNIKYSVQQIVTCDGLICIGGLGRTWRRRKKEVLPRPRFTWQEIHVVRHPVWQGGHVTRRSRDKELTWPDMCHNSFHALSVRGSFNSKRVNKSFEIFRLSGFRWEIRGLLCSFTINLNFHTNCRIKFAISLFLNGSGGLLDHVVHGFGEVKYLCEVESSNLNARGVSRHVVRLVATLGLARS